MGASREMFNDEKIAQSLLLQISNLQIQVWANHSYQNEGMFRGEILETIDYLKTTLENLKAEYQDNPPSEALTKENKSLQDGKESGNG